MYQAQLVWKGLRIQFVQPAQLRCFTEKEWLRVSTHAPSSSVRTNYSSDIEQYIRQIAHHDGNHIHSSRLSPTTFSHGSLKHMHS